MPAVAAKDGTDHANGSPSKQDNVLTALSTKVQTCGLAILSVKQFVKENQAFLGSCSSSTKRMGFSTQPL